MTEEEVRLDKNKRISQTKKDTIERHSKMSCKVFSVKIQKNKCSKEQLNELELIFLEQKWYKNYILNWSEQNPENKITKFDTKINNITKKDKDLNDIPIKITLLSASERQCLISRMYANIKTLHTLKEKGLQKPGKLKFSKKETIIDLKQYGMTHKIISSKRIKVQGIHRSLYVNGLDQFINIPEIEFANARLIQNAEGYYVQFTCFIPKEIEEPKIQKVLGIDFGCSTSFTTSEGEKIDAKIQESERLKRLQRNLSRKQKGSENFRRNQVLIQKEHQKINNQKADLANKLVSKFCQYKTVVIQDEQLSNWQKNGHGKAVSHSVLGTVKSKLLTKDNVVVLSKNAPTTKLCSNCGEYHDELKVWNREFKCGCGVKMDRDIHAAKNMAWMYLHNVGVGRTKIKRVETEALVRQALSIAEPTSWS